MTKAELIKELEHSPDDTLIVMGGFADEVKFVKHSQVRYNGSRIATPVIVMLVDEDDF